MANQTKPAGWTVETGPYGEITVMALYTCCHCQHSWEAPKGSMGGRDAGGFCGKCVGYVCKNPACLKECVPWEQRLENLEAGKHYLTLKNPIVSVPDLEFLAKVQ